MSIKEVFKANGPQDPRFYKGYEDTEYIKNNPHLKNWMEYADSSNVIKFDELRRNKKKIPEELLDALLSHIQERGPSDALLGLRKPTGEDIRNISNLDKLFKEHSVTLPNDFKAYRGLRQSLLPKDHQQLSNLVGSYLNHPQHVSSSADYGVAYNFGKSMDNLNSPFKNGGVVIIHPNKNSKVIIPERHYNTTRGKADEREVLFNKNPKFRVFATFAKNPDEAKSPIHWDHPHIHVHHEPEDF